VGIVGQTKFLVRQRILGFKTYDTPMLFGSDDSQDETIPWFLETLKNSKLYLEYGTGGTTIQAAKAGVDFIATDSDPYFLKSVRKRIKADGNSRPGQTFRHADIGYTGPWGHPVGLLGEPLENPSPRRLEKYRRYSDPPAECLDGGRKPDLVLVDGRFRIACVLKALRNLQHDSGWTVAMDDYDYRPYYQEVIPKFGKIDRLVGGRVAVMTSLADGFSAEDLDEAIRHYETDPR
jgi:hypothetical protein